MTFPHDVAIISKSGRQRLRVRIIEAAGVPLIKLEMLERDRSGEFHAQPGPPSVPGRLAAEVSAAYLEAARLIGGDA